MGFQDSLPDEREWLTHAIYREGLCGPDEESNQAAPLMLPQKNTCGGRDPGTRVPEDPRVHIWGTWMAGFSLIGYITVA